MCASTDTVTHRASSETPRRSATCFGYEVRSSLPLRYLRPGSGPPLEISGIGGVEPPVGEPVRRWIPTPEHPFEAELHGEGGAFKLWVRGTGWFEIEPDRPAIRVPLAGDPIAREERLWGFPAALCFTRRGDLPLHAAAVDVGGRALLLAAPGRFGKTTLAGSFLRAGYRLLSEDISCCRGPEPAVVPGPAMLRVRHDAYEHLEFPGTHRVGADADRVHLMLDERSRGDGSPVPVAAIVLLRTAEGPTTLERVPAPAAVQDLWALSFKLPTEADRVRSFGAIAALAARVPIWNLIRRLRYEEIDDVIRRLVDTCVADG